MAKTKKVMQCPHCLGKTRSYNDRLRLCVRCEVLFDNRSDAQFNVCTGERVSVGVSAVAEKR
jgi:hypothetical protein